MTFYRLDVFAAIRNEGVYPRGVCDSWTGTLCKSRPMTLLGATQSQALLLMDGSCSRRGAQPPLSSMELLQRLGEPKLPFLPLASAGVAPAQARAGSWGGGE